MVAKVEKNGEYKTHRLLLIFKRINMNKFSEPFYVEFKRFELFIFSMQN